MVSRNHLNSFMLLGLVFIAGGLTIMVLDEALIQDIRNDYWLSDSELVADDSFLDIMNIGWNVIGTVVFLVGIIVFVASGMKAKSRLVP